MIEPRCSACQAVGLEPGFVEDAGSEGRGYARWIPGPLQKGPFGGAQRLGKKRHDITAYRCGECGHLDLWVHQAT